MEGALAPKEGLQMSHSSFLNLLWLQKKGEGKLPFVPARAVTAFLCSSLCLHAFCIDEVKDAGDGGQDDLSTHAAAAAAGGTDASSESESKDATVPVKREEIEAEEAKQLV